MTMLLRRAAPWLVIAALAAVVVFARLPAGPHYLYVIHKTGHPLVFGLIAWILHTQCQRNPRYLITLLWALLLGGATELLQAAFQRDASWLDVGRDGIGAIAALSLHACLRRRGPMYTLLATLALSAVAAPLVWCSAAYANRALQFPVIAQFRSPLDRYFLAANTAPLTQLRSDHQLLITPDVDSSGLVLDEPAPDWSRFSLLAVDVTNPNDVTLQLVLRIHDLRHTWEHTDRYNGRFELPAHARQILRVPLSDVAAAPQGRRMDLRHIRGIALFVPLNARPQPFVVSRLWLEADTPATAYVYRTAQLTLQAEPHPLKPIAGADLTARLCAPVDVLPPIL
jgi:hypothetical protein